MDWIAFIAQTGFPVSAATYCMIVLNKGQQDVREALIALKVTIDTAIAASK